VGIKVYLPLGFWPGSRIFWRYRKKIVSFEMFSKGSRVAGIVETTFCKESRFMFISVINRYLNGLQNKIDLLNHGCKKKKLLCFMKVLCSLDWYNFYVVNHSCQYSGYTSKFSGRAHDVVQHVNSWQQNGNFT